ncbi:hypothetical protein ACU686_34735 [Yinghuangia aomiensis]
MREAQIRRGPAALRARTFATSRPPLMTRPVCGAAGRTGRRVPLVQDMRGRCLVHRDVFALIGRHLPHVPGIDGDPGPGGFRPTGCASGARTPPACWFRPPPCKRIA